MNPQKTRMITLTIVVIVMIIEYSRFVRGEKGVMFDRGGYWGCAIYNDDKVKSSACRPMCQRYMYECLAYPLTYFLGDENDVI